MSTALGRRRYLTNFEHHRLPHLFTDVLVLGTGVAGLRAALAAAESHDVLIVAKDAVDLSATSWAQGGIAAVVDPHDDVAAHAADTIEVACGLADPAVVAAVTGAAPAAVAELRAWGAAFDRTDAGELAVGREGGHRCARIVHAHGDATGREIARVLLAHVAQHPRIRVFAHCFAIDLLSRDGTVLGAVTWHSKHGFQMFWAGATILATGGLGRVYRETTNPPVATGDGLAMAFRAGAVLRDVEMVQFHPTTLYVAGAARALISEAVRGEGARLVHRDGAAFMDRYHPDGELAPRDVVSRAIVAEMKQRRVSHVYLDVRHLPAGQFATRFPLIAQLCRDFDINPERDLVPVRPSAHYTIGGVRADEDGQTSLAGLFAAGEVASTGLHGANRLASNSLLEGMVLGQRAGRAAALHAAEHGRVEQPERLSHLAPRSQRTELDVDDVRHSLLSVMWRNAAIERDGDRLRETIDIIEFWSRYVMDKVFDAPVAWQTQNMLTVAMCLAIAAATRTESRGVHHRVDYPQRDDAQWKVHVELTRAEDGVQVGTAAVGAARR